MISSSPIGPRACSFCVLIPISAPNPNCAPSVKAFEGADFIYAKNWAAYSGDNYGQILSKDRDWTVSDRQMAVTNNAYFMHCLPVRRNMIVTDDVIESPQSIVIPEAANREISATVVLKRLLEGLK